MLKLIHSGKARFAWHLNISHYDLQRFQMKEKHIIPLTEEELCDKVQYLFEVATSLQKTFYFYKKDIKIQNKRKEKSQPLSAPTLVNMKIN